MITFVWVSVDQLVDCDCLVKEGDTKQTKDCHCDHEVMLVHTALTRLSFTFRLLYLLLIHLINY